MMNVDIAKILKNRPVVPSGPAIKAGNYDEITKLAAEAVAIAKQVRG